MAINNDKIVTFSDLQYLIDNEGFFQRQTFPYPSTPLRAVTKEDAINSLWLNTSGTIASYTDSQLIPRDVLIATPLGYVCTTNDWTTPTPNEVNSIGDWQELGVVILQSTTPLNNGLYNLQVVDDEELNPSGQGARKLFPVVNGRQYKFTFNAMAGSTLVSQKILFQGQTLTGTTTVETNQLTTNWTTYERIFTANTSGYLQMNVFAASVTNSTTGDWIAVDNINVLQTPVDIYPQDNAASSIVEFNSIGTWDEPLPAEVDIISTNQITQQGSYGLRCTALIAAKSTPITAEMNMNIAPNETYRVGFWARCGSNNGAAYKTQSIKIVGDLATQGSVTPTSSWVYYETDVVGNAFGILTIRLQPTSSAAGVDTDYIEIDQITVLTIPPC